MPQQSFHGTKGRVKARRAEKARKKVDTSQRREEQEAVYAPRTAHGLTAVFQWCALEKEQG